MVRTSALFRSSSSRCWGVRVILGSFGFGGSMGVERDWAWPIW